MTETKRPRYQLSTIKYIHLDIVDYSKERPSEAQVDLISTLNSIVKSGVEAQKLDSDSIQFLPTGDGICIALLDIPSDKYDIHLQIALHFLEAISEYNSTMKDETRKFVIRIGLNENVDNLIIDINANRNVSGAGINHSQRIMNIAEGNQIFVGQSVFEILSRHEKYFTSFRKFPNVAVKHERLNVYQFIDDSIDSLDNNVPLQFQQIVEPEPKLPKVVAVYLSLAHRDRKNLALYLKSEEGSNSQYELVVAYWFFSKDYLGMLESTVAERYHIISPASSIGDLVKLLESVTFRIVAEFSILIRSAPNFSNWLARCTKGYSSLFLNDYGLKKVKDDWPDLHEEIQKSTADLPHA